MVTAIAGKWKLESSENFEEYMKALNVNWHMRKIGAIAKPTITFTISGDQWEMEIGSPETLETTKLLFKLNEEVECVALHDEKATSIFNIVDDKILRETQKHKDAVLTVIDRQLEDSNDRMVTTCTAKDVVCKRIFKRL
ncbi:hypothetical protein GJ496_002917 [Pomphorhynchus laevis]|nr:hypothetical protein GJ496_002917 [Pomphorhynchus laevis]